MVIGVVFEQLGSSFEDVLVMLDQPFRTCVRLPNFALTAIVADEPVITQSVCVLLLGDPDALSRLLFETLQLSRSNRHMCAEFKGWHKSSFGVLSDTHWHEKVLMRTVSRERGSSYATCRCGAFQTTRELAA